MSVLELLEVDAPGMMVIGSFAILVLWMLSDVRIPDGTKGAAFYLIVPVAGVMMIGGGLLIP